MKVRVNHWKHIASDTLTWHFGPARASSEERLFVMAVIVGANAPFISELPQKHETLTDK